MSKNYIVGFPRIGEQRELKKVAFNQVEKVASQLKAKHWNYQKNAGIDFSRSLKK